jgi:predicted amidophosphoribosyltransferase
VLDRLLVAVWQARCAACGEVLASPTGGPVCASCWRTAALIRGACCTRCGVPLPAPIDAASTIEAAGRPLAAEPAVAADGWRCEPCVSAGPGAISRARAAGIYTGSLRRILLAFKYRGHRSIARHLSLLMCDAGAEVIDGADVVVAVPLHAGKAWRRGFNQAADLARGLPVRRLRALRRIRPAHAQTGLGARQRQRNVAGAFEASRRLFLGRWLGSAHPRLAWLPEPVRARLANRWTVRGRTVLLVDDVRTTGATLEACARVLAAWGAREVRVLTAALAVRE